MNRWHLVFVAVLLFGGGWIWFTQPPADVEAGDRTRQPALDHLAPALDLPALDGAAFSLADLDGKPVVVNFWATWCAPCREEMPMLQATWERYGDEVMVVGVDVDEDAERVQVFVDEFSLSFPILLDQGATVSRSYNVLGLPTTLFIDGDGVIRQIYPGKLHSAILAEGIGKIRG